MPGGMGSRAWADSYNEALSVSRGELIAVLEGDDWWAPDRWPARFRS